MIFNRIKNHLPSFIKKYLFEGHERSVKAKKNILASFLIKGCSILISLALVPLTIHYVNPMRYGVWLTLSSIIAWLSFFDIGFGNGLRNKIAESMARGQKELVKIYVSTTYAILSLIVGLMLLIFLCINPFLNWVKILNTSAEMASELSLLALIVFVFFCLQLVFQLVTTVMTADQKPARASFFNLLANIFSLVTIFILTKTTKGSLLYLGLTLSIAPVLVLLFSSVWFYRREYRDFAPSLKFVRFSYAGDLMNLGIKFFLIQIAAIILYQTSNMIIAQLFGPAEVTPYNIAYKYFGVITMVFSIIMLPFWSAYTEAFAKGDITWIKNSMKKIVFIWVSLFFIIILMLILADKAYVFWVGKSIKVPFMLSVAMAFYVVINAWCGIFAQFLNGVGKIKLQLYSGLVGALINIPLAIFLGKYMGISGVVLSTCFLAVIAAVWAPVQYYKLINNTAKGIWNK